MTEGGLLLRLWRVALYLAVTVPTGPIQALLLLVKSPLARRFPSFYHRLCCRILGFRIDTTGTRSTVHPTLYVANHASYLDIPILGSLIAGSFIAKAEIARSSTPYYYEGDLAEIAEKHNDKRFSTAIRTCADVKNAITKKEDLFRLKKSNAKEDYDNFALELMGLDKFKKTTKSIDG